MQRITVPACRSCNNSWADDEAHFRNVLLVAGEPNAAVDELWRTKARSSFEKVDGHRRLRDLAKGMVPVTVAGQQRWMIYPGRDDRVLRVVRKIIRGLSHHHSVDTAIPDSRVWADVFTISIPPGLTEVEQFHHREADILEYWFERCNDAEEVSSLWILRFFERLMFIGAVRRHGERERS